MGKEIENHQPYIFSNVSLSDFELEEYKKKHAIINIVDVLSQQLEELFIISYPHLSPESLVSPDFDAFKNAYNKDNWVHFPWKNTLVHMVDETSFEKLRTNRNRELITAKEQEILRNSTVAILGLSVGSNIAFSIAHTGMSKHMILAEFDTLSTTNLNRVRTSVANIGSKKIHVLSEQIYELNPYAYLILHDQGLHQEDLDDFFTQSPAPAIIFDVIDDFGMKIMIRQKAKKYRVPVVMLTSLGDSILIDIERFDKEPSRPIFHGTLGALSEEVFYGSISEEDKKRYAVAFVGKENVPQRALESLPQIGKTLVGRPQLGSTVAIAGGIGAYIARNIVLQKESVESGRKIVKFSECFVP